MADTAIFLGAGASCAEGAPSQGRLFAEYFSSPDFRKSKAKMDRELAAFFSDMFFLNVKRRDIADVDFPTFEEVLGLTDLAIMRKEAFRHFDIENRDRNSGRLRFVAQYLVFLVAKVLHAKLGDRARFHRQLVEALQMENELLNTVFVSTNYDILIDNALTEERRNGIYLDYGVEFRNFDRPDDWERPVHGRSVSLFKPHGSLNWLFCPTCDELEITPKEKGVVTRLISEYADRRCAECGTVYSPMIVPPTFYKDLNTAFLSSTWNRTDVALRKVNHIVFCGYSFPDADMHIKYLLKRAQTNRNAPLKVTVINNHPGKTDAEVSQEKGRYGRFLGSTVNYTDKSFEQFAADPLAVIRPLGPDEIR
jgi:NAD-dependent SIR2 family protein deacetylase